MKNLREKEVIKYQIGILEMKHTLTEIKTSFNMLNNYVEMTEESVSEPEDRSYLI